jgi:REP element-mobilizing transposase RayT
MSYRKISFANDELYHICNRGVDKRTIFESDEDRQRFIQSVLEFNGLEATGGIYENSFVKSKPTQLRSEASKLVTVVCFCLNPNHFHLILKQDTDNGVQKFLQRLGTGYTKYFNNKHKRTGSLFQGIFKAKHIDTNEYLLYLSAYVNLNDKVHQLRSEASKLSWSSWGEYAGESVEMAQSVFGEICDPSIILDQFENKEEYKNFAEDILPVLLEKKEEAKEVEQLWLE